MLKTHCFLLVALAALCPLAAQTPVDPALAPYAKVSGPAGELSVSGSFLLEKPIGRWLKGLAAAQPEMKVDFRSVNTALAIQDFVAGKVGLAVFSRELKPAEVAAFKANQGFAPTRMTLGLVAEGIYVNPSNPIQSIRMDQLDAIYSTTRRRGLPGAVTTWGQLGLSGEWQSRPVRPMDVRSLPTTREWFQDKILMGGEYAPAVSSAEDVPALMATVAKDPTAITYAFTCDATPGVKAVALVNPASEEPSAPTVEEVRKGNYPFVRYFYLYVAKNPEQPVSPATLAMVTYAFSREGQTALSDCGLIPLSANVCKDMAARVQ